MDAQADLRIDPARWPDVAAVPASRLKAALAEGLVRRAAQRLPIRIERPDRDPIGEPGTPTLRLRRPDDFHRRIGAGGLIGFGESYQAGDWEAEDLPAVLTVLARHLDRIMPPALERLRHLHGAAGPVTQDNSVANAARNISAHYDLSNHLFTLFLDETMTYSSAIFGRREPTWDDLADAQRRKIDRLLDRLGVGPRTRMLEIGTGWGELAVRAAERGADVHTITLSHRQLEHARLLAARRGVADRVRAELLDYRGIDPETRYDAVASVEMIEAVGERYWPEYFAALRRSLTPDGRVGLQAITMRHDRMMASRRSYTWIHKYIFPGGLIPSVDVIEHESRRAGLRVVDRVDFGRDYAATLRLWRERFRRHAAETEAIGFDEVFRRTWEFYLAYSEAGFASDYLDVHQFELEIAR